MLSLFKNCILYFQKCVSDPTLRCAEDWRAPGDRRPLPGPERSVWSDGGIPPPLGSCLPLSKRGRQQLKPATTEGVPQAHRPAENRGIHAPWKNRSRQPWPGMSQQIEQFLIWQAYFKQRRLKLKDTARIPEKSP